MQEWFALVIAFGSHIKSSRIRYSKVLKFVSIHYGHAASGSGPNASLLYQFTPERILTRENQRRTWLAAMRQLRRTTVGRNRYPSRSMFALLPAENGGYKSMESETDYLDDTEKQAIIARLMDGSGSALRNIQSLLGLNSK